MPDIRKGEVEPVAVLARPRVEAGLDQRDELVRREASRHDLVRHEGRVRVKVDRLELGRELGQERAERGRGRRAQPERELGCETRSASARLLWAE